jgi:hypothetical protein
VLLPQLVRREALAQAIQVPGPRLLLGLERIDPLAWGWVVGGVAAAWLFADVYSRRMRRQAP